MNIFFRHKERWSVAVLLVTACIAVLWHLDLPGINFDEVIPSLGSFSLLLGDIGYAPESSATSFFGRHLPLMSNYFHASIESYLLIPFFLLFGKGLFGLRIASLAMGLVAIVLTYLCGRRLFRAPVGLLAAALLGTSPYFLFASRIGNHVHFFLIACSIGSVYCFVRWYQGKNGFFFCLGLFLIGLGMNIAWFYNIVGACAVAALLYGARIGRRFSGSIRTKAAAWVACGIASWLLGFSLFLYANLGNKTTKFITVNYALNHLHQTSCGSNNMRYSENIPARLDNLIGILDEHDIFTLPFLTRKGEQVEYPALPAEKLYPRAFFFAVSWIIVRLLFLRAAAVSKRRLLLIVVLLGAMFLLSPFTLSGFYSWHLIGMIPFVHMAVAVAAVDMLGVCKARWLKKICIVFFACGLVSILFSRGVLLTENYRKLKETGGLGSWSDAVYGLHDWVQRMGVSHIVALSTDVPPALVFLSRGTLSVSEECYRGQSEEDAVRQLRREMTGKPAVFVVNTQWVTCEEAVARMRKAASGIGKEIALERVFYSRNGMPVYEVYSTR